MYWHDFFPDECPPEEATPASGIVYRLVRKNPPGPKDFRSYREMQPNKTFDQPECIVCGVSVYRNVHDMKRLQQRVPAKRKQLIAKGTLNHDLGMILKTSGDDSSHHTWWIPLNSEPWGFFEVVTDI